MYPPAAGGHERHVQDLVEGLRGRGFDARVVTSKLRVGTAAIPRQSRWTGWLRAKGGAGTLPGEIAERFLDAPYENVNGVPVTRLDPRLPLRRRVVLPALRETLLAMKPDLIHAHDVWKDCFEVSLTVARELDVPIFLSPVYHDKSHEHRADRRMKELRRVVSKIPVDARVFFNTRWEEKRLLEAGVRLKNTDLLPPSIDFEALLSIPPAVVPGLPSGRLLISFVGRLIPEKGVDLLLRSFAEVLARLRLEQDPLAARAHLVLAGFRETPVDYAAVAAAYGIAEHVTVLVDRPRAEIVNLLRASAIFALPSRCETFGIAVIEAWATRNLVLVSDHWALPYVVRDGYDGIVCRDDAWVERLLHALRNVDTPWGRQLVDHGLETVRLEHGRERRIDHLVRCVEEASGRSSRAGADPRRTDS
jgi:glycosyltransferase involved in cell wall biosynthesis